MLSQMTVAEWYSTVSSRCLSLSMYHLMGTFFPSLCCTVSHSLNEHVSLHIISFLWIYRHHHSSFPYCEMFPVSFTWCLEFTIPAATCKSSRSFLQSLSSSMCMQSPQEARRGVISVGTGVKMVVIYGVGAENLTSVLCMCKYSWLLSHLSRSICSLLTIRLNIFLCNAWMFVCFLLINTCSDLQFILPFVWLVHKFFSFKILMYKFLIRCIACTYFLYKPCISSLYCMLLCIGNFKSVANLCFYFLTFAVESQNRQTKGPQQLARLITGASVQLPRVS